MGGARRGEDDAIERPARLNQAAAGAAPHMTGASAAAHLAAIVESSDDAIFSKSLDGRITTWNAAAERLYGHRREEVVGQPVSILVPPDRLHEVRNVIERLARREHIGHFETVRVRKDGSRVDVWLSVSPILDEEDGIVGISVIARDVTDRLRAERRRNARLAVNQVLTQAGTVEEILRQILQAVCQNLEWDVAAFWRVDKEAAVLRCVEIWHQPTAGVREFEAMTRRRSFPRGTGLPGRIWESGQPAWIPDVVRDDNFPRAPTAAREGLHAAFGYPISLGGEVLGVMEFFSSQIREPDADLLEMMSTIGSQVGQFLERKQADQALLASEQRFARFMQQLPGLAWIKDFQGRYTYANDAAMRAFQRPRSELYGKTDEEIFPPETAAQFKQNDLRALTSGMGVQVIETLADEQGIVHHSIVSKFPVFGPDGTVSMVGGMAIDITDRLRAEEALKEADRRKDEFLAILAHELRNPLAPIQNALSVLGHPHADADSVRDATRIAQRQVQHLTRLVDDLLDVSRIMRGIIELRLESIELATVISRAVETARPTIASGQHELTVSLPTTPVMLRGDPIRLAQVISNLLNNAAKYTPPEGKIGVSAWPEQGEVLIRVEDSGMGIAPDMVSRIFDMFVQGDNSASRAHGGLGIGLALVRRLVEMHGGAVSVQSGGPGMGSEFIVRLPLAIEAEGQAPFPTPATAPRGPALPKRRILVVDDNVDVATSLAMLLRMSGQEVLVVHDGLSALTAAESHRPDVVVLDLGMPGMDGYDVARRLRRMPETQKVLLVALTGWGQDEDRRRSAEAGFDHHLVKPVGFGVLEQVLGSA
jgi:PAS domain S-box-containing protein